MRLRLVSRKLGSPPRFVGYASAMTRASSEAVAAWQVLVDAIDPPPDADFTLREDWVQLRTRSSPHAADNKILRARLDVDQVSAAIDAVLEDHRATASRFAWIVDPQSAPATISQSLSDRGIPSVRTASGMVRAIDNATTVVAPSGYDVRRARPDDVEALARMGAAVWGGGDATRQALVAATRRALDQPDRAQVWLVEHERRVVGSAALRLGEGGAYLQGGCVDAEYRGRGIYTLLMNARLQAATAAGAKRAVVWADERTARPIVERRGFECVSTARFHEGGG